VTLLYYLLALPALGVVVFFHELGHFLAAKAAGVGVEVFSLGWGPRLAGFRRGGTEYRLSWLPIGGYCRFKGDEGLRQALEQNLDEMPREEGSFYSVSAWRRVAVVAAGPVASLLAAFLVFAIMSWAGSTEYTFDNRIVLASDYTITSFTEPPPATSAGLVTGDRIPAVDGRGVRTYREIQEVVSANPERALTFTIERDGVAREVRVTPALDRGTGAGRIGVYPWQEPVVDRLEPNGAAALAGLGAGDRIVRAGDRAVRNSIDLEQELAGRPSTLAIGFERQGAYRETVLVLEYEGTGASNLGLAFADTAYPVAPNGMLDGLRHAAGETWGTITGTIKGIGLLFRGVNLREAVAGPIGIIGMIGTTARTGFARGFATGVTYVAELLAFLSVTLFLMNLLPLPALDGGQILFALAEMVRGRAVRPRMIWRIQMIGFSFLVVLFLVLTYNDILRMR